ncbi:MAG: FkbM family methyltransferase [Gemmatimonadaceae bacterium]
MQLPETVRRLTDPLLVGVRVPILSGVNRGQWWSLVSSGSGYASGRRASGQMRLLAALMRPGDTVWDVGAHKGFVTLCAARRVGRNGSVHTFEPSERNRAVLRRHVRWNRWPNTVVHPFALSDYDGECCFGGTGTSKMYALGGGSEVVQVRTAATLVAQDVCPAPTFVKVDVEGAEGCAIAGLLPVLPRNARLLIAMHGPEADERCCTLLGDAGFRLVPSGALERCRAGEWESDPDLYCIGPDADDGDLAVLRDAGF